MISRLPAARALKLVCSFSAVPPARRDGQRNVTPLPPSRLARTAGRRFIALSSRCSAFFRALTNGGPAVPNKRYFAPNRDSDEMPFSRRYRKAT